MASLREKELIKAYNKRLRDIARQEAELNINPPEQMAVSRRITGGVSRLLNKTKGLRRGGAKQLKRRELATKRAFQALGAIPTAGRGIQGSGAGRPRGTYKYGIPIQQYKKLKAQRAALYSQYAQKQQEGLRGRGFTPQQVTEIQASRNSQVIPSAADDELAFQKFVAENTITPNTQNILDNLKRIQNKAITDDLNQQRVHRERLMVNEQQSILKARNLFGPDSNKIDIFDDRNNILKAENVFNKQNPINILKTGRPTLLDQEIEGTRLKFF